MREEFGTMYVNLGGGSSIRLQGDIRIEDDYVTLYGDGCCHAKIDRSRCLVEELEDTGTLIVYVS